MLMAVVALPALATLAGCSQVLCSLGVGRACAATPSAVAAAPSHTFVLKSDGTLWAWGRNSSGQLGDGSTTDRASPVQVDVASLELLRPRSVGVEQVALWAMEQVRLITVVAKCWDSTVGNAAAAVGSIIGRMAAPGSERATYRWLCQRQRSR